MATPLAISENEYHDIFGSSDEELEDNNSDIDFEGFEINLGDSGSESSENSDYFEAESGEEEDETWSDRVNNYTVQGFSGVSDIRIAIDKDAKAEEYFLQIFSEAMLDHLVVETNNYARQSLANNQRRLDSWKEVSKDELKAFFGLCIVMGINRLPEISDYWKDDSFLCNEGIKRVMPRNRFQEISQFLHFADNLQIPVRGQDGFDRLFKVRPVLNEVLFNSQRVYLPGENISVDEGMIAFKGRLGFRQYMPAKPTKYGIKVWMAADAQNGVVVNFNVYLGSEARLRLHGLGYDVVMKMVQPYMNTNRKVYFDNFFSSTVLLEDLQLQQTYACSTVRCNRRGLPQCAKKKLSRPGELVQAQKGNVLFTKWHDKRDVAFLSTSVSPGESSRTVQRTVKGQQVNIIKPQVSDQYTANMGGVDRADQLRSFYYAGRQSRKWYKYLFWFAFNLAACNSYILECVNRDNEKQRPQEAFSLELAKRLINNFNSRKRAVLNISPQSNQHPLVHKCAKIDEKGNKRLCVECKNQQKNTAKGKGIRSSFMCHSCHVALCKDPCFRDYHARLLGASANEH